MRPVDFGQTRRQDHFLSDSPSQRFILIVKGEKAPLLLFEQDFFEEVHRPFVAGLP
jgi:hypothetical protein